MAQEDEPISDNGFLLRRVHPNHIVEDKNIGRKRPSSAAFSDPNMSVDSEEILVANNDTWTYSLRGYDGYSLAAFQVGVARLNNQTLVLDPLPNNPAHVLVTGRKPKTVRDAFVGNSEWRHLEP